jgi:hypothetical protein
MDYFFNAYKSVVNVNLFLFKKDIVQNELFSYSLLCQEQHSATEGT